MLVDPRGPAPGEDRGAPGGTEGSTPTPVRP